MSWNEARKRAFIISVIRGGTQRWPPKYKRKEAAKTEKKKNELTGRLAQHYRCEHCEQEFPSSMVEVDHVVPVVDPKRGFVSWDEYIERMFCEEDGFQLLCKPCHEKKTKEEQGERYESKRSTTKRGRKSKDRTVSE